MILNLTRRQKPDVYLERTKNLPALFRNEAFNNASIRKLEINK